MSEPPDLSHHEELNLVEREKDLRRRTAEAGGPDALIATLVKGVRRQGRILKVVTFFALVDIVLSVLLAVAFVNINHNTNSTKKASAVIAKNSVTLHDFCLTGNTFFRNDRVVWTTVLNLPTKPVGANPGLTIGQLLGPANVAYFNKFLDQTFKPRVCK